MTEAQKAAFRLSCSLPARTHSWEPPRGYEGRKAKQGLPETKRIRAWIIDHMHLTPTECAEQLGIAKSVVNYHRQAVRGTGKHRKGYMRNYRHRKPLGRLLRAKR